MPIKYIEMLIIGNKMLKLCKILTNTLQELKFYQMCFIRLYHCHYSEG